MATEAPALAHGQFIVGEFIKTETVTKTGPTGPFNRVAVKLLLDGEFPKTVEFPPEKVPAIVAGAQRGDTITLPFFIRAFKDRAYLQGVTD